MFKSMNRSKLMYDGSKLRTDLVMRIIDDSFLVNSAVSSRGVEIKNILRALKM